MEQVTSICCHWCNRVFFGIYLINDLLLLGTAAATKVAATGGMYSKPLPPWPSFLSPPLFLLLPNFFLLFGIFLARLLWKCKWLCPSPIFSAAAGLLCHEGANNEECRGKRWVIELGCVRKKWAELTHSAWLSLCLGLVLMWPDLFSPAAGLNPSIQSWRVLAMSVVGARVGSGGVYCWGGRRRRELIFFYQKSAVMLLEACRRKCTTRKRRTQIYWLKQQYGGLGRGEGLPNSPVWTGTAQWSWLSRCCDDIPCKKLRVGSIFCACTQFNTRFGNVVAHMVNANVPLHCQSWECTMKSLHNTDPCVDFHSMLWDGKFVIWGWSACDVCEVVCSFLNRSFSFFAYVELGRVFLIFWHEILQCSP